MGIGNRVSRGRRDGGERDSKDAGKGGEEGGSEGEGEWAVWVRRGGGGGEVGRQRADVDGEERGRPCREREDEEAYLHAWGCGGDGEKPIDDGGV